MTKNVSEEVRLGLRVKELELQICKLIPWVTAYKNTIRSFKHDSAKADELDKLVEETNHILCGTHA